MIATRWGTGLVLIALCGCAESNEKSAMLDPSIPRSVKPTASMALPGMTSDGMQTERAPESDRLPILDPTTETVVKSPARRIIYNADVVLTVEDFPSLTREISALVARHGGFVADTELTGSTGRNRHATWKLRVPVEKFDVFLDAVSKLGELQQRQIHSQDITEEFFDLEARVKNKKVEEARLVKLLTESTGKLEEILSVEREISRVREEIERMEGRVRLLANLSDLTTINIVADERIKYLPATTPTFSTRLVRSFTMSTENLMRFLEGVAILAVSVVPWLPLWICGGVVLWLIVRILRRRLPFSLRNHPRSNPA